MKQADEIKELKVAVNNLMAHNAFLSARTKLLESLLFEVINQTLPEHVKNIYTLFVNRLEERTKQGFEKLDNCYYDTADPAFSVRQKFDVLSQISRMKQDDRYLHQQGDNPDDANP